jgi:dTDP-4-dehydrorhamnose 3,5-epimerase
MIEGVEFKSIISHVDERGYFRELIRKDDKILTEGLGQVSHSLVYSGVIKGWHGHEYQTQWNYVVNGLIFVALFDARKNSSTYKKTITFLVGDFQESQIYKFPPGVLHGYKCISGPMNIIYFTSGQYDLKDEIRVEHNNQDIGFDWINNSKIK